MSSVLFEIFRMLQIIYLIIGLGFNHATLYHFRGSYVDIPFSKYGIFYMKGLVMYRKKCIEGLSIKRNAANAAL